MNLYDWEKIKNKKVKAGLPQVAYSKFSPIHTKTLKNDGNSITSLTEHA